MKIYIFDEDKRKIITMDRDAPRLVWDYPHAPANNVMVYKYRDHSSPEKNTWRYGSSAKDKWHYRYWGTTREELCDRVNAELARSVEAIEAEAAKLHARAEAYRLKMISPKD
jgi:hypothetical protein